MIKMIQAAAVQAVPGGSRPLVPCGGHRVSSSKSSCNPLSLCAVILGHSRWRLGTVLGCQPECYSLPGRWVKQAGLGPLRAVARRRGVPVLSRRIQWAASLRL